MHELWFQDSYYGSKYSANDPQARLVGVNYCTSGSLIFTFRDSQDNKYEKSSRDTLEMLILSECLYGSKVWKYSASITQLRHTHYRASHGVSLKVTVDDAWISYYKDTSVALKVYFSHYYNSLPSYGGWDSYPKLRDISYPSYTDPIDQPVGFKLNLYPYQKKSISKMLLIEKKEINLTVSYNYKIKFGEVSINFNPLVGSVDDNMYDHKLKITTNGGILADEMGLGKTITSLSLVALNPCTNNESFKRDLIVTKATLIVCPSHLSKQWESEVKKILPKSKIISLLTKNSHTNLTYQNIKDADIVIVTHQFLMNFKYYPQLRFQYCTPSNFVFSARITSLTTVLQGWRSSNEDIMSKKYPNLEHFNFHRLIVDEGHEIFGLQLSNASMAKYMAEWLDQVKADYKWFVSGTPFVNYDGLKKCFQFIDLKLKDAETNHSLSNEAFIHKKYILDNILSNVMIRHRKGDVENQIEIPGYEEDVIWVKLTDFEDKIYQSKKSNSVSDTTLQQLCCHILCSDTTQKVFGNVEIDLESMQDHLIEHHKKEIEKYKTKLDNLVQDGNQAYNMIKKNYTTKLSESKYMLAILEKMSKKDEIDLEQNCSICFDTMQNPSLTSCGHMFCKNCLDMCLKVKKSCPMCKANLEGKEIYLVESKVEEKNEVEETNPMIKKYGSKLGKLISVVRKLVTDDNNRIIIFSQWDKMLNLIGKTLSDNGVENSFVKGNVWSRNAAISKFKMGKDTTDSNNKVIMLSLSNSASGTNLTEATHIIFVEPINCKSEEVKAIESQAIGRACRLGQKNKIKVIRILTRDTIEQNIYDDIYSKNLDKIKRNEIVIDNSIDIEV